MDKQFEALFKRVESALKSTLQEMPAPKDVVYVCGFWLFYNDYTTLGAPAFAYNTVGNENVGKWSPPEWVVDVEDHMAEALQPLYGEITAFLAGKSDDEWNALIKYQWDFYCQFCLALNDKAKGGDGLFANWNLSDDFVVGIFDARQGDELYETLIKSSVGEAQARSLGILQ